MSEKGGGGHEIRVQITTEKRSPSSSKHARPFSFGGKFLPPLKQKQQKQQQQQASMPQDVDSDEEKAPPFHFRHPVDLTKTRLLIIIWLAVITMAVLFLFIFGSGTSALPPPPLPITPIVEKSNKNSVSFNLLDTLVTTVSLPDLNFDKLLRYDVCCYQQTYFICRSITKNLGVDCYLTKEKTAVVRLFHPDMTGARCTIVWSESN
jgi:hypothetical protein